MRFFRLGLFLVCFILIAQLAYASIPIYCPHCKTHLYNYAKDEIIAGSQILAKDFTPANDSISQPQENTEMVCPLCFCPLNQYESWAWEKKVDKPIFNCWAVSLLTKDKNGNFVGVPYDIKYEDWEQHK